MGLFSGPKIPAPPPPPPPPPAPPTIAAPGLQAGLAGGDNAMLSGAGFGGTLLTGATGAARATTARPALRSLATPLRSLIGG